MKSRSHKELIVWQRGMELATEIYRSTAGFPKEETYGLTSQIRRSAVSIPSNIAEGHGRRTDIDFARFLRIANGSLRELDTQVILAEKLSYLKQEVSLRLQEQISEVGRLLAGLMAALTK